MYAGPVLYSYPAPALFRLIKWTSPSATSRLFFYKYFAAVLAQGKTLLVYHSQIYTVLSDHLYLSYFHVRPRVSVPLGFVDLDHLCIIDPCNTVTAIKQSLFEIVQIRP